MVIQVCGVRDPRRGDRSHEEQGSDAEDGADSPGTGATADAGSSADEVGPMSRPTLRVGSVGSHVEAWQPVIGANPDGDFGEKTETKTKAWQLSNGLTADGIVGENTWRAAGMWEDITFNDGGVFVGPEYGLLQRVPARWHSLGERPGGSVKYLVIHSAETPERPNTARGVANYFQNPTRVKNGKTVDVKASAHYCVDSSQIIRCVDDEVEAWHVRTPGWNRKAIGIELAGRASQTREQWLDVYGMRMLPRAAWLAAWLCHRWGIPIQHVTGSALKTTERGITGHADLTSEFRVDTHTDPGTGFPWPGFIAMVQAISEGIRK